MPLIPEASPGSFWVGDVPADDTVVSFEDETGDEADLSAFTGAEADLIDPNGDEVEAALAPLIVADTVEILWPDYTVFEIAGIYQIVVRFQHGGDNFVTAESIGFVVQERSGWHSMFSARQQWADATGLSDVELYTALEAAKVACVEYAPTLEEGAPIPLAWKQAQLLQARAIWTITQQDNQNQVGMEGLVIRTYPLDWNIRQLLRPKTARPVVR